MDTFSFLSTTFQKWSLQQDWKQESLLKGKVNDLKLQSFTKYLLTSCCVPSIVLSPKNTLSGNTNMHSL